MPRLSKKSQDLQAIWENRIQRSKQVRKTWKDLFKVEMARDYLDGKQKDAAYSGADWITVNNLYSHLKAQLPALYGADPYFYVKLAKSFYPDPKAIALWETRGRIRASYLNYLKRELKLKKKVRISIQDAFSAYGVAKTRYVADILDNPNAGKPIVGENDLPLTDPITDEPLVHPEKLAENPRYKIDRVHPDDMLWDEDAGPLEDSWSWVAQCIRMTYADALQKPKFKTAALNWIKNQGEAKDDETRQREERKKGSDIAGKSETRGQVKNLQVKEPEMLVFWEIYDLKQNQWLIIAENGRIPVMDPEPVPPGIEDHPFSFLMFTHRDDSPYPHPPLSPLLDLAKEYNRARSDIQKHRKRFNRKYVASRQAFGDDMTEISKIESGDDGTIVVANGEAMGAVAPINDAQLDPMRYNELSYLKAEMVEMVGHSSSEAQGIAGAESATQAAVLDKRLEIKEGDSMSMVMDFVTDIARKLDMLVQTHIERAEAVKISGPQGDFWELVQPEDYADIQGEYEYVVNIGATIPRMPHIERASWMAFLGIIGGFPHLLTNKRLLTKMAEMHHIEDEAMLDELFQLGQKIMGGQVPFPGQSGSQPGIPEERPVSAVGGQAGGIDSFQAIT